MEWKLDKASVIILGAGFSAAATAGRLNNRSAATRRRPVARPTLRRRYAIVRKRLRVTRPARPDTAWFSPSRLLKKGRCRGSRTRRIRAPAGGGSDLRQATRGISSILTSGVVSSWVHATSAARCSLTSRFRFCASAVSSGCSCTRSRVRRRIRRSPINSLPSPNSSSICFLQRCEIA